MTALLRRSPLRVLAPLLLLAIAAFPLKAAVPRAQAQDKSPSKMAGAPRLMALKIATFWTPVSYSTGVRQIWRPVSTSMAANLPSSPAVSCGRTVFP